MDPLRGYALALVTFHVVEFALHKYIHPTDTHLDCTSYINI